MKPLKIVLIYGEMSSRGRGPYVMADLYRRKGLTGSESSFFNLARGLAAKGHEVVVLCDCLPPANPTEPTEWGFLALPMESAAALGSVPCDVAIAWNEPDYLELCAPGTLKLCAQQLNDWRYVRGNIFQLADCIVYPSQNHADYMTTHEGAPIGGCRVIPNSIDRSMVAPRDMRRNPKKVVYCSSPDRGLHHLLSLWPEVRARVPDAELHVFYRLAPWIADVGALGPWAGAHPDVCESARRARYVDEALRRMATGYGVVVRDLVPNVEMSRELASAGVLAYPCDPLRYTEGFGVSALDAVAAGCRVVISGADALPSVHGSAATVIEGPPDAPEIRARWVDAVVKAMTEAYHRRSDPGDLIEGRYTLNEDVYLMVHDHRVVTDQWEALIREQLDFRVIPDQPAERPRFTHPEVGEAVRVRQRGGFRFWETTVHGSWWSMEDEQVVRDRWWHPKASEVVIDGGAAFGSYALPALAAGARVVCFSPAEPDTQCLVANLDLNPEFAARVLVTRDGLAHKNVWFDPAKSEYLENPSSTLTLGDSSGVLRCRALDSWLADHPEVDRVDWIKLDVEGAELDALKGAEQCLRKFRPKLVIECHNFHRPMEEAVRDYVLGLDLGYTFEAHPHGGVSHAYFEAK